MNNNSIIFTNFIQIIIMRLQNFKKDFTSIIGMLFIIADLVYWIAPMFMEKEQETSYMLMLAGAFIGLGLMFAPNDLYSLLKKRTDKTS